MYFPFLFFVKQFTVQKNKSATKIREAKSNAKSLYRIAKKFKEARDEGTLGPDEVKEIAEETIQVLENAAAMIETIAEEVPSREIEDEERDILRDDDEDENSEHGELEMAQETDEEKKERKIGKEEEKEELKEKIATMEKQIAQMTLNAKKEKLAQKYASLFPEGMKEAKIKEIMKSDKTFSVIEAKVETTSDILKNNKLVKVAQEEGADFKFSEVLTNNNDSNFISFEGKL